MGASLTLCRSVVFSGSVVVSETNKTLFVLTVEFLSVAVSKS